MILALSPAPIGPLDETLVECLMTGAGCSLASRIDALSTAFDAYVELGDLREQLDDFPDTAAVRRDASSAILAADPAAVRRNRWTTAGRATGSRTRSTV